MTAAPSWAREDGKQSLVEAGTAKIHSDVAVARLHGAGTGSLPIDTEQARLVLTEEQRHNRGTRPRTRRWRSLDKLDTEIDRLMQKQVEATVRVRDAEQALTDAPRVDAGSLADWIAGGERGERPAATLPERERELAAARLLGEAVMVEIDRALERRLQFMEKNREKMLGDARKDTDHAREALRRKVAELAPLRRALIDARETLTWVAAYPEQPQSYGFETATCLGIRKPVEAALGTTARVEYVNLVNLLSADADALSDAFSAEQLKQLGQSDEATPLSEAMWNDDPRAAAWRKQELERARAIGEYSTDLNTLADESREFRS